MANRTHWDLFFLHLFPLETARPLLVTVCQELSAPWLHKGISPQHREAADHLSNFRNNGSWSLADTARWKEFFIFQLISHPAAKVTCHNPCQDSSVGIGLPSPRFRLLWEFPHKEQAGALHSRAFRGGPLPWGRPQCNLYLVLPVLCGLVAGG